LGPPAPLRREKLKNYWPQMDANKKTKAVEKAVADGWLETFRAAS